MRSYFLILFFSNLLALFDTEFIISKHVNDSFVPPQRFCKDNPQFQRTIPQEEQLWIHYSDEIKRHSGIYFNSTYFFFGEVLQTDIHPSFSDLSFHYQSEKQVVENIKTMMVQDLAHKGNFNEIIYLGKHYYHFSDFEEKEYCLAWAEVKIEIYKNLNSTLEDQVCINVGEIKIQDCEYNQIYVNVILDVKVFASWWIHIIPVLHFLFSFALVFFLIRRYKFLTSFLTLKFAFILAIYAIFLGGLLFHLLFFRSIVISTALFKENCVFIIFVPLLIYLNRYLFDCEHVFMRINEKNIAWNIFLVQHLGKYFLDRFFGYYWHFFPNGLVQIFAGVCNKLIKPTRCQFLSKSRFFLNGHLCVIVADFIYLAPYLLFHKNPIPSLDFKLFFHLFTIFEGYRLYKISKIKYQVGLKIVEVEENQQNDKTVNNQSEKNICMICLDDISPPNSLKKNFLTAKNHQIQITIKCKHQFHGSCLFEWLFYQRRCPYCRAIIETN